MCPLSVICVVKISPHSVTCLLIPSMVFFKENRFLILNVVQCIDHFLYVKHFWGLKKCWPISRFN